ncbi:MAG: hypothetical protein NC204_03915 [Candidatus Amulumruptor caecigallinarius]|nr:hypothetical protein [Candidatus Amulumruptor caecigallinarius]
MRTSILMASAALMLPVASLANNSASGDSTSTSTYKKFINRLSVGGYGEVAVSRNFHSNSYLRYIRPEQYKDQSYGTFDIPHVVINLGYDFGHGWTMGTEIEFEHGGTESAVEFENEEGGEYEQEVERGGEVALEQFWLQKSFMPQLNLRAGMIVVPVGETNAYHLPTEFFGVYRPEGENTIMPCTWHEIGLSIWGRAGAWRYEAMFLPGLDSERFGNQGWIHDGSASPYEFKLANVYAGAFRVDNFSVPGLRLSLSGYVGNSFKNTMAPTDNPKNDGVHGTVLIGSFGFQYKGYNFLARGHFDYGHLTDSHHITTFNMSMSSKSPSKRQKVASDALATGVEVGYNFFGLSQDLTAKNQKLYLFGRYDYYDSMYKMEKDTRDGWCQRSRYAVGLNYFPIKEIVVKAEYSIGVLHKPYNNEPAISFGIAYAGWFL